MTLRRHHEIDILRRNSCTHTYWHTKTYSHTIKTNSHVCPLVATKSVTLLYCISHRDTALKLVSLHCPQ